MVTAYQTRQMELEKQKSQPQPAKPTSQKQKQKPAVQSSAKTSTDGILSQRRINALSTPGSAQFTGYHQGNWYIGGVNKGKNLSSDDMSKLSTLQGTITNSIANQSLVAQNKEKDLALTQSNLQYAESQRQNGLLSKQVEETEAAQTASQTLQTEKTAIDEAQTKYANAEASRTSALSSEQGRSSLSRSRRIRNRARSRQQGLLSNRLMQTR